MDLDRAIDYGSYVGHMYPRSTFHPYFGTLFLISVSLVSGCSSILVPFRGTMDGDILWGILERGNRLKEHRDCDSRVQKEDGNLEYKVLWLRDRENFHFFEKRDRKEQSKNGKLERLDPFRGGCFSDVRR